MKITFLYPSMGHKSGRRFAPYSKMEPLMFSVLAGLTPPGIKLALYDERIEDIPFDEPADLVAITAETYTAKRVYEIADQFRARRVPVVIGGCHATLMPDEALNHADAVVSGEAEDTWQRVLEDNRQRRLSGIYRSSGDSSLAGLRPRPEIFRGKRYLPVHLVFFGRGCGYNCRFCTVPAVSRKTVKTRPVQDVVSEIMGRNSGTVFFVDDNIAADIDRAKDLFRQLIPLKMRWVGQVSIDHIDDDELVDLMAKSGCRGVLVGVESLSESGLLWMGKYCNIRMRGYEANLRKLNEHGIMVWGSFLLGCDGDTMAVFDEALVFALDHKFALASFNPLTPFPGTPVYEEMRSHERLPDSSWWLDPSFRFGHAVIRPMQMTAGQLTEGCMKARLAFTRYRSIMRRSTDFKANSRNWFNAFTFFGANLVARREIALKQGLCLGLDSSSRNECE